MQQLLPQPQAILIISAQWASPQPLVNGALTPATIHDFAGFPAPLYALSYPAPGAPALAEQVVSLLQAAGISVHVQPASGMDHEAWTPLMLAYPALQIPVMQLSIQSNRSPEYHLQLGRALQPLR